MFRLLPVALCILACAEPQDAAKQATPQTDAAPSTATQDPPPRIINTDRKSADGFHLDPDPEPSRPIFSPTRKRTRPIELILRSTPPGATASVDGRAVGKTPAYYEGNADGRARDVTFALPGYAVARYRFVATQSGVVHGTLRRQSQPKGDPK